jgi:hypothetical protein
MNRRNLLKAGLIAPVGLGLGVGWNMPALAVAPTDPVWWGWTVGSTTPPPRRLDTAFSNNTGLWFLASGELLPNRIENFTSSRNGQVVSLTDITGDIVVKHSGVIFDRCRYQNTIEATAVGSGVPPKLYFCDGAHLLGAKGNTLENAMKGHVEFYNCNLWAWTDALALKQSGLNANATSRMRGCFIHDLRIATDPYYGPNEASHNDICQVTKKYKAVIEDSTLFCWGMNNFTSLESATRDSGPHWTNKGSAETSVGYAGRTAGYSQGRINAGVQPAGGSGCTITMDRNLFRGYAYRFVNATSGCNLYLTNNRAAPEEVEKSTAFGNKSNYKAWSGNTHYKTGATL